MVRWDELESRVNRDAEFRMAARHWDARLRLDLGETSRRLRFEGGRLTGVEPCAADAACELFVRASQADWRKLLAPVPPPYFHDLFGAQMRHDVRLPEDMLAYAAYYPALRRLMQLLSECREEAR